jgi:hypothetical protein
MANNKDETNFEILGVELTHQTDGDPIIEEMLLKAEEHRLAGRVEQAKTLFQDVLKMMPEHAEANYALGLIASGTREEEALLRFECAVLAKPEEEQHWVSYIESLVKSGAMDSAADALDLGMKYGLRPNTAQALAEKFTASYDINRIGFLIHTLEMVNHYASVWDLLPEGSFDVLLYGDAAETVPTFFENWKCNVVNAENVIRSGNRYLYLVSNHPVDLSGTPLIKKLGCISVRFMYAAGKLRHNLSKWNSLYDVILCFGPYHANLFLENTDAVVAQMGYPRFDRYFTQQPDMAALYAQYACEPAKKTVVWLPTWKALSSVSYFDAEISALTDRYNVVVKLHPLMPGSEPERVEALRQHHFTHLITDTSDNLPLYQIADFMLFDYGGPPLAGIYTNKNFILLNVEAAAADELTGEDSPDITIRRHLVNVNSGDKAIAELLADSSLWEQQDPVRRALRKTYFAPYYGFSSNVAANALLNLKYMVGKGGSH